MDERVAAARARTQRSEELNKRVFPAAPKPDYTVGWSDPEYQNRLRQEMAAAQILRDRLTNNGALRVRTSASLWRLLIELKIIRDDVAPEREDDAAEVAKIFVQRLNLLALDIHQRRELQNLSMQVRDVLSRRPWTDSSEADSDQPYASADVKEAAIAAEETIEHALARLFLRLGPPPESTDVDFMPAGRGGGGAQQ
ncbi:hypothetical protein ABTZ78_06245 [Streptomyces bauhiniae]|uniref:hypothetical protein n=1 Tax=Streptomyces bauhiniae TaxID=2340725 RepID=UPI0033259609